MDNPRMIVVNGEAIWFVFQIISDFIMNTKVFYEICISNDYGL